MKNRALVPENLEHAKGSGEVYDTLRSSSGVARAGVSISILNRFIRWCVRARHRGHEGRNIRHSRISVLRAPWAMAESARALSCSLSKTLQGHGRWGRRQPSSSGATEFTGKHPPHLHDSVDGLVDGYRISISSKDEVGAYEGG